MECLICGQPAQLYTNGSMLVRFCDHHKNDYAGMTLITKQSDRCGYCKNLGQCCQTYKPQEG
jgi:hypothetical protein